MGQAKMRGTYEQRVAAAKRLAQQERAREMAKPRWWGNAAAVMAVSLFARWMTERRASTH